MMLLTFLVEALVTAVCMSWGDSSPLCRMYRHQLLRSYHQSLRTMIVVRSTSRPLATHFL